MPHNHQPKRTSTNGTAAPRPNPRLVGLQRQLLEAFDGLWDDFVDPADALYDLDGSRWTRLSGEGITGTATGVAFGSQQQLAEIRAQCRRLAVTNEFAINGHENLLTKPPSCF